MSKSSCPLSDRPRATVAGTCESVTASYPLKPVFKFDATLACQIASNRGSARRGEHVLALRPHRPSPRVVNTRSR